MVAEESRDALLRLEAEAVVAEAETLAQFWESGILSIEQAEESSVLLERLADFVGEGISEELMDDEALSRLLDVTTKLSQISVFAESHRVPAHSAALPHRPASPGAPRRQDSPKDKATKGGQDPAAAGMVQVITVKEGRRNLLPPEKATVEEEEEEDRVDASSVLQNAADESSVLKHSTSMSVDWYNNHMFGDGSQDFSGTQQPWQPLADDGVAGKPHVGGITGRPREGAVLQIGHGGERADSGAPSSDAASQAEEELDREEDAGEKLELPMATAGEDGAKLLQRWRWWLRMQQSHEDSDTNDTTMERGPSIRVGGRISVGPDAQGQHRGTSAVSGVREGGDMSAMAPERFATADGTGYSSTIREGPPFHRVGGAVGPTHDEDDVRLGSLRGWSWPRPHQGERQVDTDPAWPYPTLGDAMGPPLPSPGTPEPTTPQPETNRQKRDSASSPSLLSKDARLRSNDLEGAATPQSDLAAPPSPSTIGALPDDEIAKMLGITQTPVFSTEEGSKLIERLNAEMEEQSMVQASSLKNTSLSQRMFHHHRGSIAHPPKPRMRGLEAGSDAPTLEAFVKDSHHWFDALWNRQNMLMVAASHHLGRPNLFDSQVDKLHPSPGRMDPELRQFRMSKASRKLLDGRGCQSFEERNRQLLQRRAEAVQRWRDPEEEELAKCTWKPALNPVSLMIAGHRSRDDLVRWDKDRRGRILKKQKEREREVEFQGVQECTFQPLINEKSRELAVLRHAHQEAIAVTATAVRPSKKAEAMADDMQLQMGRRWGKDQGMQGGGEVQEVHVRATRKGKLHRKRPPTYPKVTEMVSRALLAMEQLS